MKFGLDDLSKFLGKKICITTMNNRKINCIPFGLTTGVDDPDDKANVDVELLDKKDYIDNCSNTWIYLDEIKFVEII